MTPEHLQGLNPPQLEAVKHVDGPLLILAGAGSGKTRVLTRRIAHLLQEGVKPWNILAVTFTNKAAAEMKERTTKLIGHAGSKVWVSTFHSTCVRILRQEIEALGYTRSFVIYDTDDQMRLYKDILKELKVSKDVLPPRRLRSIVDKAKTRLLGPDDLERDPPQDTPRQALQAFQLYEKRLKAANALDFSDLINKTVTLFQDHPQVRRRWQDRFQYLMVDEYQDTNRGQYLLVKLLGDQTDASGRRNVAVVGDDDQSIYSFRGADIRNILDFEVDFPEAKVVRLEQNYRSTKTILSAAMAVVRNNSERKEKELWTQAPDGDPIRMIVGRDEDEEGQKVAQEIAKLVREGRDPGDIAIIYRTNARSRSFEMALQHLRLPHVLVGARKFYERKEVRDVLSYLRVLLNPSDDVAFQRAIAWPRRGVGATSLSRLQSSARAQGLSMLEASAQVTKGRPAKGLKAFNDLVQQLKRELPDYDPGAFVLHVAEESGYLPALRAEKTRESEDRIRNVQELARGVDGLLPEDDPIVRLRAFLDQATLAGQDEELPDGGGRVTLMTAHLAKGLEYPVVFVAGVFEGSFPMVRGHQLEEALEEERRLMYVAVTRAQQRLYLTRPLRRRAYGENGGFVNTTPSPFLREIPRELMKKGAPSWRPRPKVATLPSEHRSKLDSFLARHGHGNTPKVASSPSQTTHTTRTPQGMNDLKPRTRVLHERHGQGVIVSRQGLHSNVRLTVRFDTAGTKLVYPTREALEIIVG